MDEFLSIEDLRWEFGASRAWMYKYLAPHIKSITVKCSTDDGERLCKRYSLDDARRVVAEEARAEVYSVPVKADPGKSSYAPYRRPRRVRIKTSAYIAEYIVGFGHLWQIDEIAEEYCGKRSREAAYQFIYRNAWIAIVFGNKTFYIPRRTTPQFVAAAVEVFGDAARSAMEKELRKTLRHEFRHHIEAMAGADDLDVEDARRMEEYRREDEAYRRGKPEAKK